MNDHIQSLKSLQVAPLEKLLFWRGSLCHRQEFLLGFEVARGSTISAGFCHVSCLSAFLVLFGTFFGHFFFTSLPLCLSLAQGPSPSSINTCSQEISYQSCLSPCPSLHILTSMLSAIASSCS